MDLVTLLRPLEALEAAMAEMYEHLSSVFGGDPEASGVFFRLALEERRHLGMVRHARRLARTGPNAFGEVDADLAEVQRALEEAARLRAADGGTDLAGALRAALEIEVGAAEGHYRLIVAHANPEIASLLEALSGDDRRHAAALRELLAARTR